MIHFSKGRFHQGGVELDPTQPAFRFGAGFFETILWNGRKPCHLDLHLDRIFHSLRAHGFSYETVDFLPIIQKLVEANRLADEFARINIFYPAEEPEAHPVVLAAPYEAKPYKAYRLCMCADRHISPLNAHKTTSYMFFNLALKLARSRGFDDAALTDFDDALLESTTGALLLERGGELAEMDSPYRLESTTLKLARTVHDIAPKKVALDDLPSYRHAYLLNSLIGMRPVVAIGEIAFVPNEDRCAPVTELALENS